MLFRARKPFHKFGQLDLEPIAILLATFSLGLVILWDNGFFTSDSMLYYRGGLILKSIVLGKGLPEPAAEVCHHVGNWLLIPSYDCSYFYERGILLFMIAGPLTLAGLIGVSGTILARIFFLLLFALVTYMVYKIGMHFGRWEARVSTLLMIFGSFTMAYSYRLMPHLPEAFFIVSSVFCYIKYMETEKKGFLILTGAAAGLAFSLRFWALWVIFPLILHHLYSRRPVSRIVLLVGSCLGIGLVKLCYLWFLYGFYREMGYYLIGLSSGILLRGGVLAGLLGVSLIAGVMIRRLSSVDLQRVPWSSLMFIATIAVSFLSAYGLASLLEVEATPWGIGQVLLRVKNPEIILGWLWDIIISYSPTYQGHVHTSALLESMPFLAAAPLGAVYLKKERFWFDLLLLFPVAFISTTILVTVPEFTAWDHVVRFLVPVLPFLCLLSAIGFIKVGSRRGRHFWLGFAFFPVVYVLLLYSLGISAGVFLELTAVPHLFCSRHCINQAGIVAAGMLFGGTLLFFLFRNQFLRGWTIGGAIIGGIVAFLNVFYMDTIHPSLAYIYDEAPQTCILGIDVFRSSTGYFGNRVLTMGGPWWIWILFATSCILTALFLYFRIREYLRKV